MGSHVLMLPSSRRSDSDIGEPEVGTDDDMDCVDEGGGGRREEVRNFFFVATIFYSLYFASGEQPVEKGGGGGGEQAGLHVPDDEPHPVPDQHGCRECQAGGEVNFTPKK